jgi:hypothetical protein
MLEYWNSGIMQYWVVGKIHADEQIENGCRFSRGQWIEIRDVWYPEIQSLIVAAAVDNHSLRP